MKFTELSEGCIVSGLAFGCNVKIKSFDHIENASGEFARVTYEKPDGTNQTEIIYPNKIKQLKFVDTNRIKFDADGYISKLLIEAQRIQWAHIFDPYIAMHTSDVEPLPHQIEAVYGELLKRQPLRFLLADDPGAGKTIMAGLFIKELMIRGDIERCLIVCPGSLCEQWQDEMHQRFNLVFTIFNNQILEESVRGNAFMDKPLGIASIDKLARDEKTQKKLVQTDWDLIICDEAHKMSAHLYGSKIDRTKRYQLGERLSEITRHFLLMTATPHNGIESDFQLFMRLLDRDQFDRSPSPEHIEMDFSNSMRRMVKEDLMRFDGTKLFPKRVAETKPFKLSFQEKQLYDHVTSYVQNQFNLAENLSSQRKGNVGFALTILQRRLASSPMAIYKSLERRLSHMEEKLEEALSEKNEAVDSDSVAFGYDDIYDYLEELNSEEQEQIEDEIIDRSTAALSIEDLEVEIEVLKNLKQEALEVLKSDCDQKWRELAELMQSEEMTDENGEYRKLIIFSEHKDTIEYIYRRIIKLLGNSHAVVKITGGMRRDDRRRTESEFTHNRDVKILVATDAAGEGINLQRAHLMVNYDLPWNPNRIEQRFGRIHRIGQERTCRLWNMLANETREGAVFDRLFRKLQQEQESLGGSVFDVLGKVRFSDKHGEVITLAKLLQEAIRSENNDSTVEDIERRVEAALDREKLREYIEHDMLAKDTMNTSQIMAVKRQMEIAEARKLQPYYIYQFFAEAFKHLGGRMRKRPNNRFEILKIPIQMREHISSFFGGRHVPMKYENICFEKEYVRIKGKPNAELIHPGHELMHCVIMVLFSNYQDILEKGTVLIDSSEGNNEIRTLYYVQSDINDATEGRHGRQRQASRKLQFIEINRDGVPTNAGIAPYLDYQPANEEQYNWVKRNLSDLMPNRDFKKDIQDYAAMSLVPEHLSYIQDIRDEEINKTREAVQKRLNREIRRQDTIYVRAKEDLREGKAGAEGRITIAKDRIADLQVRLKKRMELLDRQQTLSPMPPRVLGCALIVPKAIINSTSSKQYSADAQARKVIEMIGMKAVMDLEEHLGFCPEDVSAQKCGYDICSISSDVKKSGDVRFIEVKARIADADYITITPNEHITALNKPESYYLAIVKVDGEHRDVIYLKEPFENSLDDTITSVNVGINDVISKAKSKQEWSITEHGIQEKTH